MRSKIVTDTSFGQDVIASSRPVLVDFYADWCGHCRAISPALDEIGDDLHDNLTVTKLNVDESPEAAARYGVRSLPTLMLFRDGKPVATRLGSGPKSALRAWIDETL